MIRWTFLLILSLFLGCSSSPVIKKEEKVDQENYQHKSDKAYEEALAKEKEASEKHFGEISGLKDAPEYPETELRKEEQKEAMADLKKRLSE